LYQEIIKKAMKPDPTTQSNYLQIATDHVNLEWLVDFNAAIIKGTATHDLIARVDGVNEVMSVH
jgi:leukotriene-A4 hydrolase